MPVCHVIRQWPTVWRWWRNHHHLCVVWFDNNEVIITTYRCGLQSNGNQEEYIISGVSFYDSIQWYYCLYHHRFCIWFNGNEVDITISLYMVWQWWRIITIGMLFDPTMLKWSLPLMWCAIAVVMKKSSYHRQCHLIRWWWRADHYIASVAFHPSPVLPCQQNVCLEQ